MKWASLLVGMAVGISCLTTGCAGTDIAGKLFFWNDGMTGDRVLAGDLETVAQSTSGSLGKLGLKAVIKPGTESYRVESETKSGLKFVLVLTRVPSATGERTRVKLEWLENRQDQSGLQILAEVEKYHYNR